MFKPVFKPFSKLFGNAQQEEQTKEEHANAPSDVGLNKPEPETQAAQGQASIETASAATRQSLIGKIWDVLSNSSSQVSASGTGHIPSRILEAETLEEQFEQIEEVLLRADVGFETAVNITDSLRNKRSELKTAQDVMKFLKQTFEEILAPYPINPEQPLTRTAHPKGLNIILVVGVNGAGKTTFIGKMAHRLHQEQRQVVVGAGDTFRAAATEQLEVWAQRASAFFVSGKENADSAAVLYDALQTARTQNADTVLLDTAGRLQNKYNLMEELRKIRKVIDKDMESHQEGGKSIDSLEVLLVLDATTGQNALKQAEVFKEAVDITGVVLTKLDGSAKGGIILSVAKDFQLPVKLVGIGEKIGDLKPFVPSEFINTLFSKFG